LIVNGESTNALSAGDGLTAGRPGTSAYQIKQDYPASPDGLFWIQNPAINGGELLFKFMLI